MATWVKVYTPGGYSGLNDATFVVDVDSGRTFGFHKVSGPTYYITSNGVMLEGGYGTADDALAAVLEWTNAHTFASLITYS